ncbi:polysaccharide biosynthesis C-terminal domain-containing protein [Halorubrum sp. Hd13]|uniref:oligosaccharide flippase family protein n=1 Tax=Halorubrum sp. Hd13 TaxID=1480728 RepID=UPI000B996150|nr:polysaccharide biosynthesis C-terminal domain-containing protein [Halorubrum sp. Hd13]OYR42838.1 transporter [Halorubrum sp. Hd13]
MRLGQTSLVHFASRFLASVLGFVSTVFIGRILGSSGLGTYYLVLSMIAWLGIATKFGVPGAVTKRVSEGESQSAHTIAGVSISTGLFILVAGCVLVFREPVNNYVGYPAANFVVLLLFANIAQTLVNAVLKGQQLVHISGIFNPIRTGTRSVVQITTLFAGLGLVGLFAGYTVGYALVAVLGTYIVVRNFDQISLPRRSHFRNILSYAKFSWIGSLRSRAFNWVDVSILGFFVSTSLVGIYTAAWNIAVFLILFGGSLSQTLFPEMSSLSADNDQEQVSDLFETALAFAGLILIPGFVGATVLGERLLRVYGSEFSQGAVVLSVLIIATLIQGYQRQFTTTLNAIDRPDLSFRVNAVFIIGNVILNVSVIPFYNIFGAAAATAASVAISLGVAYVLLSSQIGFSVPTQEIAKQWVAAGLMGVVVFIGLSLEETHSLIGINIVTVLVLVGLGATVYFATLLVISSRFRTTIKDNLPV